MTTTTTKLEKVSLFCLSAQKVPLARIQNGQVSETPTVGVLVIINLNTRWCASLQTVYDQASSFLCVLARFSTFVALGLPLNNKDDEGDKEKTRRGERSRPPAIDQMIKSCTQTHIVELIIFDTDLCDQLKSSGYPLSPVAELTSIDLSRLIGRANICQRPSSSSSSTSPLVVPFHFLPPMPPPLKLPPMPPSLAQLIRGRKPVETKNQV
ncbi:hypothetical protein TYRP_011072 [Tyrophagus putrescentiae]|nr:hypothetical protein TYRP_011072 [Tyrophagus putrescentiae]